MYLLGHKYHRMRCLRKLRCHAPFFFFIPVPCGCILELCHASGNPKQTPEAQETRARDPKCEVLRSLVLSTIYEGHTGRLFRVHPLGLASRKKYYRTRLLSNLIFHFSLNETFNFLIIVFIVTLGGSGC